MDTACRTALLSTTYFGPVQWYQKLHRYAEVRMEAHEHFVKQSYRNRCLISTTQGVQALTVPVAHDRGCGIRDVRISDHGNWRHLHWNALCSAYGDSPFFEFYADDLAPFFERRWTFLYDFNEEITATVCRLLDIRPRIVGTDQYMTAEMVEADGATDDFREVIRPKHPLVDSGFEAKRYYQVFEQKHGFLPNLSILDLLMNEGNESIFFL